MSEQPAPVAGAGRVPLSRRLAPVLILLLCLALRVHGIDWDQGSYLHPDERFLTMLGARMHPPASLVEYLDPRRSPWNPPNAGAPFFVYGTLPLTLDLALARLTGMTTLRGLTLQGRLLAALADALTAALVLLMAERLARHGRLDPRTAPLAMLFYAFSVLPVQLAHFFTVEPFLTAALAGATFAALAYRLEGRRRQLAAAGLAFGLAMATKVTALAAAPLLLVLVLGRRRGVRAAGRVVLDGLLFGLIALATARVADPHLFAATHLLDLRVNPQLLANWHTLASLDGVHSWYPPAVQWIGRTPVVFALSNLARWGLGPPLFALALAGGVLVAVRWLGACCAYAPAAARAGIRLAALAVAKRPRRRLRLRLRAFRSAALPAGASTTLAFVSMRNGLLGGERRHWELPLLVGWAAAAFLLQAAQPVASMRYFAPLYPILALLAGVAARAWLDAPGRAWRAVGVAALAGTAVWPLAFQAIYTRPHTRVAASRWLAANLPRGAHIAVEHWDDPLPLPAWRGPENAFVLRELPVFDPDTDEKWRKMAALLADADALVLASNRGWGSIPRVPASYPRMSAFYADLLAGRTPFVKVLDLTSFPALGLGPLRLTIPDERAEEAFTVYDHPRVMIFRRRPAGAPPASTPGERQR